MAPNSTEYFIEHVRKRVSLDPAEVDKLLASFHLRKVKRKEFLMQPGPAAKWRCYVLNGVFRSYVINEEGEDHTIQIAPEDWWVTDYDSYLSQIPATMFIVAVEDSEVMQIDFETEKILKASHHKFETFFRMMAERTVAFGQKRVIISLSKTAEERYNYFTEIYPQLADRVPQYALASYLGMTPEFLSRIRNKKSKAPK
jgi:CRP-like cAMP-binding protein